MQFGRSSSTFLRYLLPPYSGRSVRQTNNRQDVGWLRLAELSGFNYLEVQNFSLQHHVQTVFSSYSESYSVDTGIAFLGYEAAGA
jgi:hypothetical protein